MALLALSGCGSNDSAPGSPAESRSGGEESTRGPGPTAPGRGEARPGTPAVGSRAVRGCGSRVESGAEGTAAMSIGNDIDVGPVTFSNLREAARRSASFFQRRDGGYPTWKTLLSVKADATVTIVADRGLGLNYDRSGDFVADLAEVPSEVVFKPCPPSEPRFSGKGRVGSTTEFNGGFVSAGPGCRTVSPVLSCSGQPSREPSPPSIIVASMSASACPVRDILRAARPAGGSRQPFFTTELGPATVSVCVSVRRRGSTAWPTRRYGTRSAMRCAESSWTSS